MTGAHLANPIRGELGYAHWPQLSTQIWGPLGQEDVCPNGYRIFVQQFGKL